MSKEIMERCPFREGSASRKLFMALARSEKPLSASEVARTAHLSADKTKTLLNAYQNPYHCSPMLRTGVRLEKSADGYSLKACKAQPNAKRPRRGERKSAKAINPAKKSSGKPKTKARPPEPTPVELPAEVIVGVDTETDSSAESAS